jgi:hypothetical protein
MSARIYSKWTWLRWALFVGGSFLVAGAAGGFAAWCLQLWLLPGAGFCAAAAVVVVGYLAAPAFKLPTSGVVFVVGAVAAWIILEPSWLPESYGDRAYQRTHLPVLATYCGGILGLLVTALLGKTRAGPKPHAGKVSAAS